ncbi:MAG: metallophosphoesterase family protein [Candidatus Bathyarchaeota archaeon]|nr:MAG: metallophosphoesterase family protein [Candidatus Bathyarchaeota archaeon]
MRILATTDFHGHYEVFQKITLKATRDNANVIVISGDVTHFGSKQLARELLSSMLSDNMCPVLFVPGNCDPPALAEEKIGTIESIHAKCKRIGDFNFLGVGGSSPSPFDTPFELTEKEISDILEEGLKTCQVKCRTILVSHSPPKDTLVDVVFNGEHVGSSNVRDFIERERPNLVLCGHIHEAIGTDKIGETVVVNPGPARHEYCALIDLNNSIDVTLDRL